jgi:hypothetical protein
MPALEITKLDALALLVVANSESDTLSSQVADASRNGG